MDNLAEMSDDIVKQNKRKFWKAQVGIVIGAFLYTIPYNLIITPMELYNYSAVPEYSVVPAGLPFYWKKIFPGNGVYGFAADIFLFGYSG